MSRWPDKATQAFETEESIQRYLRAERAREEFYKDKEMSKAKDFVAENATTLHSRRLSINSAGQVQGAVDWNKKTPSVLDDFKDGWNMLQANKNTTTPSIIRVQTDELKKKVEEYKKMLVVVNDPTLKAFINLMLSTVQEELAKISAELQKLPNQYGFVDPYTPQCPSPSYPGLSPGLQPTFGPGEFVGQAQETLKATEPYTICAGRTCTTFDMQTPLPTSLVETLYNNNEENS